jgi:uncharacterized membrane protein
MNRTAPRSIDQYLRQLREELAGADAALIQDASYDAEEYLRAEVAAHPDKSEADVLELIASTYGSPEEVAGAYRDTEIKVKAAMATPRKIPNSRMGGFFGVFFDPRAYTSLFFMLLCLGTGIFYFVFAITGLSLSAGLSILVIGIPFFLSFVALSRVVALAEGRLIEAMTGARMPRRPSYQGNALRFWPRMGMMLKDPRTWSTLAYFLTMLPLGIIYFVIAIVGLSVSLAFMFMPIAVTLSRLGLFGYGAVDVFSNVEPAIIWDTPLAFVLMIAGLLLLTCLMHVARGIGRLHAMYAKSLLVARTAPGTMSVPIEPGPLPAHTRRFPQWPAS